MQIFDAAVKRVSLSFAVISAALVAIIMLLLTIDVTTRFLTGASVPGALEFVEVLLVAAVFLGLAYAMRSGAHVGVDIALTRFSPRAAAVIQTIGLAVAVVIISWATYQTSVSAWESFAIREYRFGLVQVPVWPARVVIPVGFFALLLEVIIKMIYVFKSIKSPGKPADANSEQILTTSQKV